ncbi:glycoside hydrolase family 18 protein [Biscogniauxia sp. FL1348]|nr:glycoside hydrolase family 18 protein [Biscogniauxia sp. FL1348]
MLFLLVAIALACIAISDLQVAGNPLADAQLHRRYNQTVYKPLFTPPSKTTPRFLNSTHQTVNPLFKVASDLTKRAAATDGDGTCAPGTPCSNGACCSKSGFCGYSPDFCGSDNCISNCDAKAACGKYAAEGKEKCPLNVCCSQYGFCGTTDLFCGDGCDESGGLCGDAPGPTGKSNSLFRSIGYYESWANTRSCDKVSPRDLDLTGLTHMNFAFAFFHPTTFQVAAMDSNAASLIHEFTSLRAQNSRLQTWISVGGWSFNDPGNNPDTRTAFSDMVSTAANRQTFIDSLISFMRNYGFDGADIDWEYPSADDRGGRPEDKENFVLLLKEMQAAFKGRYGISVTLPSSYWYLQHFDVAGMEPYVSWFNLMSYDLHGVWDSSNRNTGPYVRPHTNLTEIADSLSLLWRAGVSAGNVVMGLGFYGRSFTLTDPSCADPWCTFREGGKAGECTNAIGILSAAEISRIIDSGDITVQQDEEAVVKWIHWDADQWVSFDDEETFVAKSTFAKDMGLSGTMVWAVDQGLVGKTNLDYIGNNLVIKKAGYSQNDIVQYQSYLDAGESCYVSFCGDDCKPGYFPSYQMKGEVGDLGPGSACEKGEVQNLCCATGAFLGRCGWYGWRGQGLSCYSGGCIQGDTLVTVNTNEYFYHPEATTYKEDRTCNGGTQSYCCRGFQPSLQIGRDPELVQAEDLDNDPTSLSKRDVRSCAATGVVTGGSVLLVTSEAGPLGALAGLAAGSIATAWCLLSESEASTKKLTGWSGPTTRGQAAQLAAIAAGQLVVPPTQPRPKASPKNPTNGGVKMYGRYALADYSGKTYCETTYTCEYGLGFDQVCDNQRWGLDEVTNPNKIFHYDEGGSGNGRTKDRWKLTSHHNAHWYRSFNNRLNNAAGNRLRCEIDEFPLNSLKESAVFAKQALRAIDGNENGAQGNDWGYWLLATWYPCSTVLGQPPPVTWAIDDSKLGASDGRKTAAADKVIAKYGFDSTSGLDACYATYTDPGSSSETPVPDHGFRVLRDDSLFNKHNWPQQNWAPDPVNVAAKDRPTSVASANWKRDVVAAETMAVPARRRRSPNSDPAMVTPAPEAVLGGDIPSGNGTEEARVTKVELRDAVVTHGPQIDNSKG